MLVSDALTLVDDEIREAMRAFPDFNSPHEALAVLEEEVAELRQVVHENKMGTTGFENDAVRRRFVGEACQCAAMAVRAMVDLG